MSDFLHELLDLAQIAMRETFCFLMRLTTIPYDWVEEFMEVLGATCLYN